MKDPQRKERLIDAALEIASRPGRDYRHMSSSEIAERAGCTRSLLNYYWRTKNQRSRDVMRAAIQRGHLPVVAQGLVAGDRHAHKAPPELQRHALEAVIDD